MMDKTGGEWKKTASFLNEDNAGMGNCRVSTKQVILDRLVYYTNKGCTAIQFSCRAASHPQRIKNTDRVS